MLRDYCAIYTLTCYIISCCLLASSARLPWGGFCGRATGGGVGTGCGVGGTGIRVVVSGFGGALFGDVVMTTEGVVVSERTTVGLGLAAGGDAVVGDAGLIPNESELISFLRSYYRRDYLKLAKDIELVFLLSVATTGGALVLPDGLSIITNLNTKASLHFHVGSFDCGLGGCARAHYDQE